MEVLTGMFCFLSRLSGMRVFSRCWRAFGQFEGISEVMGVMHIKLWKYFFSHSRPDLNKTKCFCQSWKDLEKESVFVYMK